MPGDVEISQRVGGAHLQMGLCTECTVEPPHKRHVGTRHFVYGVFLSFEVKTVLKNEHLKPQSVSFISRIFPYCVILFLTTRPPKWSNPGKPLPRNEKTVHIREPGRMHFSRHWSFCSNHRVLPISLSSSCNTCSCCSA